MSFEQTLAANESEEALHKDQISESLEYADDATHDSIWRFFSKWSMPAGTPFGIETRIHILNILWLGMILYDSEINYYFYPKPIVCISVVLALMSHEMCHAIVARLLGHSVRGIVLMLPLGALALIQLKSDKPLDRIAITLSGPLINLLTALAMYLLLHHSGSTYSFHENSLFRTLYIVSLAIGIFNLVPLYPMDGGRILKDLLLLCKAGNKVTDTTTLVVSIISFIIMVVFSIKESAVIFFIIALIMITIAVLELGLIGRNADCKGKKIDVV